MKTSEIIKNLMYEGRLTQSDIAILLNCTPATVSRLRNDKQNTTIKLLKKLVHLAEQYGVKVDLHQLITEKD